MIYSKHRFFSLILLVSISFKTQAIIRPAANLIIGTGCLLASYFSGNEAYKEFEQVESLNIPNAKAVVQKAGKQVYQDAKDVLQASTKTEKEKREVQEIIEDCKEFYRKYKKPILFALGGLSLGVHGISRILRVF